MISTPTLAILLASCGGGGSPQDPATITEETVDAVSLHAIGSLAKNPRKATDPAPAPATWTICAAEWATTSVSTICSFSGIREVRYGANNSYAYRTATGSIVCNNETFGDPAPGIAKVCEYSSQVQGSTTPAPALAPSPASSVNALFTDSVFAPTSFWYKPIPANTPLHPKSANYVTEFLRQKTAYYNNVTINTTTYASPVYIAEASTPTVKVGFYDCQNKGNADTGLMAQWAAVPIPSHAVPADGTDSEMTVYQPSTNTLWEFWVTRKVNGQWEACWGGQMKNTSSTQGIWTNPYGTTATGLPFLGGQITAEELSRGEIRHAIGISLVDLEAWSVYSWPANRSDGYNPNNSPNRIPEGSRFRLNPNINVDALSLHPVAKIIAKAAQKYGFVVWDKAGAISLRLENPKSYTTVGKSDPYVPLFGGTPSYAVMDGFPWDQLQFLPSDYGKP